MKRLISVLLPLLLAAFILTAGTMVPQLVFRQQRQDYLNQQRSVPVEDVHPYGEEYEEKKNALLAAIQLLWELDSAGAIEEVRLENVDEMTAGVYKNGLSTLSDFYGTLLSYQPDIQAVLDFSANQEYSLINLPADESSYMGQIFINQEELGAVSQIFFDLETGLPVYTDLMFQAEEMEPLELWEALMATYEAVGGIAFNTQSDETNKIYVDMDASASAVNKYKTLSMNGVSADGVFILKMEFYQLQNEVALRIWLESNNQV